MINIGLRKKFLILTLILSIIGAIQVVLVLIQNDKIMKQTEDIKARQVIILNKAHQLKLTVVEVQQWLTDISATRALDGLDDGFEEAEVNAIKFRTLIQDLMKVDQAYSLKYKKMLPLFDSYYKVGKKMAHAYINGGPAQGNLIMAEFDSVASDIAKVVDTFLHQSMTQTASILTKQEHDVNLFKTIFIVGMTAIFIGIAILYFFMTNSLSILPDVLKSTLQIKNGDLTKEIKSYKKDEIGKLIDSIEHIRQNLIKMITQILNTAEHLQHTTGEVSKNTNYTNDTIADQQAKTMQIASAMTEMTATIQEVVQTVHFASNRATQAKNDADSGRKIISANTVQIKNLSNELKSAGKTIQLLEQDSQSITSIVDVIKGISDQTNLLALNAAIEAARAGETGRGFAVVADEVRALASRTQESTAEINHMIDKLLTGSRLAVDLTNHCIEQTDDVVEQSNVVLESFANIANSITDISDMTTQIATATEEQASTSKEINENIVNIETISSDVVEHMTKLSVENDELSNQSRNLINEVQAFKM